MSEHFSTAGAGDVLSSIRRLVSEDQRSKPRAKHVAAVKDDTVKDKLILTPSQRIGEPEGPETGVAAMDAVIAALAEVMREDAAAKLRDNAVVVDLAGRKPPREDAVPEPEGDGDLPERPAVIEDAEVVAEVAAGAMVSDEGLAEEQRAADVIPFDRHAANVDATTVARALGALTGSMPEVQAAPPGLEPLILGGADDQETARRIEEDAPEQDKTEIFDEEQSGEWPEPEDIPAGDLMAEPDYSMLDEGALRDIVRDVLRAELEGDLGERITRNVRKMVRAEIARALLARGDG